MLVHSLLFLRLGILRGLFGVMGYTVEMSFNILKNSAVEELKTGISTIAVDYNCSNSYGYIEMDYNKHINRNHCVIVVQFNEKKEDIENMINFIKIIKRMKHVYIECIYLDDISCKLIYASSFYITNMDKSKVQIYQKFLKEKKYTEEENLLLQVVLSAGKKRALTV